MLEIPGKYGKAKIYTDTSDANTQGQVREIMNQSYADGSKVRIMPDCHSGKGCVVGTTMTITDKIVPNLVGVDIGCGVTVIRLGKDILDERALAELDQFIHREIPSGMRNNDRAYVEYSDVNDLRCLPHIRKADYNLALGSLGGGNHFIEVDRDAEGCYYLVIHSGSRNLGKQTAEWYQNVAEKECKTNGIHLHKDICYLTGQSKEDYLHDMGIVQNYATINRNTMASRIVKNMGLNMNRLNQFTTVHNYIDLKNGILRKGAVSAMKDEVLIIPINMRDGSLICVGKGNDEWNQSAPHGAGRLMSRTECKRKLDMTEFKTTMKAAGIYTTSVHLDTLDESPMAYKPMEEIVGNIQDTVEVKGVIKPIYNFKAGGA